MSATLDLHPASPAERLDSYRNVHDVWSGGLEMEAHLRRRLQSVQHNRAAWFVGTLGGRVVTSLACYPLEFRLYGNVVPGISIGSVHTVADCRRGGFATRLIEYVEADAARRGAALSLLYSDIDPGYYARLGYRAAPAHEGWIGPELPTPPLPPLRRGSVPEFAEPFRLVPRPAGELRQWLTECYAACQRDWELSIERSPEYGEHLLAKAAADEFYAALNTANECRGYAVIGNSAGGRRLRDWAVLGGDDAAASLLAAVIRRAREEGAPRVGGWLPDSAVARHFFPLTPRGQEITMLKPLSAGIILDNGALAAAAHFREIDHV